MSSSVFVDQEYAPVWSSLFEQPKVDRSIVKYSYTALLDTEGSAGINGASKQWIKFNVNPSNQYVVPAHAYLDVVFRLVKANGAVFNGNEEVTIAGNPIHMFEEARLSVNNRVLESHINPGISAHVNYLTSMPSTMLKSTGYSEGFIPDTGAGGVDINPIVGDVTFDVSGEAESKVVSVHARPNVDYNEGYDLRLKRTNNSKWVQLRIPLARIFNFLASTNIPITGIPVGIELKLNRPFDRYIINMTDEFVPAALEFKKLDLMMPFIQPSEEVEAAILSEMVKESSTNILYDHQRLHVSPEQPGGVRNIRWDIDSIKTPPTAVTILFIPRYALSGDAATVQSSNPCLFPNLNVARISLNVGSEQFPSEQYQTNFIAAADAPLDYVRLYQDFLSSSQSCASKACVESCVSYDDFRRLTTLYHFDLSYIDVTKFDRVSMHTLRLNCELASATGAVMNVYALIGRERLVKLQFSGDRRTTFDFNNE